MKELWLAIGIILAFIVFYEQSEGYIHAGPIMTSGSTRNMSYDIRGDPYIPYTGAGPWYQATIFPIRNRRMIIGA